MDLLALEIIFAIKHIWNNNSLLQKQRRNEDKFYYLTKKRMDEAVGFWEMEYEGYWTIKYY